MLSYNVNNISSIYVVDIESSTSGDLVQGCFLFAELTSEFRTSRKWNRSGPLLQWQLKWFSQGMFPAEQD
jgi:hypothetical protein